MILFLHERIQATLVTIFKSVAIFSDGGFYPNFYICLGPYITASAGFHA